MRQHAGTRTPVAEYRDCFFCAAKTKKAMAGAPITVTFQKSVKLSTNRIDILHHDII